MKPEQTEEAVRLLARAYATNPLHVAVFGTDLIIANEAFFRIGLTVITCVGIRPTGPSRPESVTGQSDASKGLYWTETKLM